MFTRRNIFKYLLFALAGALGIFVLLLFLGWVISATGLKNIIPPALVEEYTNILGNLVSVGAGFYLINVLWSKKEHADEVDRSRKTLLGFYTRINTCCIEINHLLREQYPTTYTAESEARDEDIQEQMRKIKTLGEGVGRNLPDLTKLEDDDLREQTIDTWSEVQATVGRLPVGNDFRTDFHKFQNTLAQILAATQKGITTLDRK